MDGFSASHKGSTSLTATALHKGFISTGSGHLEPLSIGSVCVITVTYSSRYDYLAALLGRVEQIGITNVLIYDNNEKDQRIPIHQQGMSVWQIGEGRNVGTAKAYGECLVLARSLGFKYAYLLDDDNMPCLNSFKILSEKALALEKRFGSFFALCCERVGFEARSYWLPERNLSKYVNASILGSPNRYTPPDEDGLIAVQNSPYGGLFLPLEVISVIGLPRQEFVLYVDDIEFTRRISKLFGSLFLCVGALVEDQEEQGIRAKNIRGQGSSSYFRNYYAIRNQIVFDKQELGNRLVFSFNRLIFIFRVLLQFLVRYRSFRYLRVVSQAVRDGERCNLGERFKLASGGPLS